MRMKRSTTSIVRGSLWKTALQKKQKAPQEEEGLRRNGEISAARRKLLLRVGLPLLALLLLAALVCGAHFLLRPKTISPTEGERLVAIPAENALLETIEAGDIVQFYTAGGSVGSIRYVMAADVGRDSLTVLMTEQQLMDYLAACNAGSVLVVPVICGDAAASAAAVEQQRRWNAPDIALSLPETQLELEVGQTARLEAETAITPADATRPLTRWETSDAAIVTVDENGAVSAVGAGTARITAFCGDVSASCDITVLICASGLFFDAEQYEMTVGQELTPTLGTDPENATERFTWTSSDEAVVTVSENGVVTAHTGGAVTISATGRYASASCTIHVSVPASGVVLNRTELPLTVGQSAALMAAVLPEEASDKTVAWYSSDTAIATVGADGTVQAVSAGTATITASCGDASAACTVTVSPTPAAP